MTTTLLCKIPESFTTCLSMIRSASSLFFHNTHTHTHETHTIFSSYYYSSYMKNEYISTEEHEGIYKTT